MAHTRKLLTSVVALTLAAATLLGGTFAWQSISQTAENETANIVNPGGRLHDDFDGENKDIYVENFGDEAILARVRLEEYFALVINQGKEYAKTETKLGTETRNDNGTYTYSGDIYVFNEDNLKEEGGNTFLAGYDKDTEEYRWNWTVGSADSADAYYMPTFNKNKDSLVADVNGWYKNGIGSFGGESRSVAEVITTRDGGQYEGYTAWKKDDSLDGSAIYDIDRNSADELAALSAADLSTLITDGTSTYDQKAVKLVEESHNAKKIGTTNGLVSMADWLAMIEEDGGYSSYEHGGYWVYDTDGWVYWSSPIQPGSATGRLLDGIQLNGVMNDSWYYAINVVAQFVTPDDLGKADGTGFYDTGAAGETPITESAEKLLSAMTAVTNFTLGLDENDLPTITVEKGTTIALTLEGDADWQNDGFSYLSKDNFTIGDIAGTDFTRDETRAASGSGRERFTAGTYGTLDLDYEANTATVTLKKSARITVTDPDGERTWQGMIEVYTDWSKLVTMRNVSPSEYDLLCSATNEDNSIMHWIEYRTLTNKTSETDSNKCIERGGDTGDTWDNVVEKDWSNVGAGLRPAFACKSPETDCTDLSVGDVVVIGTIYTGGNPLRIYDAPENHSDAKYGLHETKKITLGAALEDSAYHVKAVYVGDGLFVCDRVVIVLISWNQIQSALS